MKSLIFILLLIVFTGQNSFSQTIIRVSGVKDEGLIRKQVERSLSYLDVQKPMHLYIVYSDLIPAKLKGITLCVPASDTTFFVRIRINARLDKLQRIKLLAHEMLHVRQYLTGDLEIIKPKKIKWKGKEYPYSLSCDREAPWELEAYRHDQYLAKILRAIPDEVPKIASKNTAY